MSINIAIDGTAGSGKGTIAKGIANELGIYHLDSGAIYRAITYKCLKEKVNPNDEKSVCQVLKNISLKIIFEKDENGKNIQLNILDEENLGRKIRTEEISSKVSLIAQYSCVRNFANAIQLELAKKYDVVIEGRDIGTIVLPNADFKFYITASAEERARRRMNQLSLSTTEFKNVLKEIKDRDKRDMEREISPLKVPEDAFYIDNTTQKPEDTLACMLNIIKSKQNKK